MEVVAEGIETEKQLAHLKAMSCTYGQGYFFSKPLNARASTELILEGAQHLESVPSVEADLVNTATNNSYVN